MNKMIKNPILPGFYPDPSICRVDDDFYLITSSFCVFPGIPVFKSRDLANWEQIGNALDRIDQHYVTGESFLGGVMAPTIRYHDGMFYIMVANFDDGGNIMITAKDPAGPWSDPIHLGDDIPGIDASIFFDDDGKCYAHGTASFDEDGNIVTLARGEKSDKKLSRGIWACEYDIKTMKCVGEKKLIWHSALINAASPEAPHIYKRGEYYYLIIAEGGTEHFHAVTVARSRDVLGYYDGFEANPVLTHRHLGYDYPIGNIGHADLVELKDGSWYSVMLGSRIRDGFCKNLGRESYICPVKWERDWPMFSVPTGKVEWEYPLPESLTWTPAPQEPSFDDFDSEKLAMYWTFMGTPLANNWSIHDSALELKLLPRALDRPLVPFWLLYDKTERVDPEENLASLVARRQRHFSFDFSAKMRFAPQKDGESAGLVMTQASNHMFRLEQIMQGGKKLLRAVQVTVSSIGAKFSPDYKSEQHVKILAETAWDGEETVLKISQRGQMVTFLYGTDSDNLKPLFENADAREINPEEVGGMIGTMLAMFASSNGEKSDNSALFDWSEYIGIDD